MLLLNANVLVSLLFKASGVPMPWMRSGFRFADRPLQPFARSFARCLLSLPELWFPLPDCSSPSAHGAVLRGPRSPWPPRPARPRRAPGAPSALVHRTAVAGVCVHGRGLRRDTVSVFSSVRSLPGGINFIFAHGQLRYIRLFRISSRDSFFPGCLEVLGWWPGRHHRIRHP